MTAETGHLSGLPYPTHNYGKYLGRAVLLLFAWVLVAIFADFDDEITARELVVSFFLHRTVATRAQLCSAQLLLRGNM